MVSDGPRKGHVPAQVHNEKGKKRVVVTKDLLGERWLEVLKKADCQLQSQLFCECHAHICWPAGAQ